VISGFGRCILSTLTFTGLLLNGVANAHEVEGLRLWSGPESTRVVLDLSAPTPYRIFSLDNPYRVVIDLTDTRAAQATSLPGGRGFVVGVRTGVQPQGELRVVLDVNQRVNPQSFVLEPNDVYGHRLVIDLTPTDDAPVAKRAPRVDRTGGRAIVIAIDAGHGGDDPGATGSRGVHEKDVVLGIARNLTAEIEAQSGMKPVLVRDGDYYLPHRERMGRARRAEADLFVSIHADAFRDSRVRGATVYVLSEQGATDEAALRLAERENASDLIGGVSLADKDELLARVLLDLSQSAAISASAAIGDRVIKRLGSVATIRKSQIQQAPFLVLKSPDIPSILIETAYISNPSEELALKTAGYQRSLARAIHDGIVDYFRDNPPADSYFALNPPLQRQSPVQHLISRGETLSGIAQHYNVSLPILKQVNSLSGDVIRIGQVLSIPAG